MRLLLDTHILLWWLNNSPKLSVRARKMIADPGNTVFVSAVTLWEIRVKQSLGKLVVPPNLEEEIAAQSFEDLPLLAHHTRGLMSIPWLHRDPFDRMLIAQARAAALWLVTADPELAAYGEGVLLLK